MTIKEFYAYSGGDFNEVIGRLGNEERVLKFLKRFDEEESLKVMLAALEDEDYTEAFRAVHSIKGICLNLGLAKLLESSSELCEALRNGKPEEDISRMVDTVKKDYESVCIDVAGLE